MSFERPTIQGLLLAALILIAAVSIGLAAMGPGELPV